MEGCGRKEVYCHKKRSRSPPPPVWMLQRGGKAGITAGSPCVPPNCHGTTARGVSQPFPRIQHVGTHIRAALSICRVAHAVRMHGLLALPAFDGGGQPATAGGDEGDDAPPDGGVPRMPWLAVPTFLVVCVSKKSKQFCWCSLQAQWLYFSSPQLDPFLSYHPTSSGHPCDGRAPFRAFVAKNCPFPMLVCALQSSSLGIILQIPMAGNSFVQRICLRPHCICWLLGMGGGCHCELWFQENRSFEGK